MKINNIILFISTLFVAYCILFVKSDQNTGTIINVKPSIGNQNAFSSIKSTLQSINNTSVIILDSGVYKGSSNKNTIISNIYSLSILGSNTNPTIVDCSGRGFAFNFESITSLTLENLIFQNCTNGIGGAVSLNNVTNVYLTNVQFLSNRAMIGGALYIKKSQVTIINATFANNVGTDKSMYPGGSAIYATNSSTLSLSQTKLNCNGPPSSQVFDIQLENSFMFTEDNYPSSVHCIGDSQSITLVGINCGSIPSSCSQATLVTSLDSIKPPIPNVYQANAPISMTGSLLQYQTTSGTTVSYYIPNPEISGLSNSEQFQGSISGYFKVPEDGQYTFKISGSSLSYILNLNNMEFIPLYQPQDVSVSQRTAYLLAGKIFYYELTFTSQPPIGEFSVTPTLDLSLEYKFQDEDYQPMKTFFSQLICGDGILDSGEDCTQDTNGFQKDVVSCGDGYCNEVPTTCLKDCYNEIGTNCRVTATPPIVAGNQLFPGNDTLKQLLNNNYKNTVPGLVYMTHGVDALTGEPIQTAIFDGGFCPGEPVETIQNMYRGYTYNVPYNYYAEVIPECNYNAQTTTYMTVASYTYDQTSESGLNINVGFGPGDNSEGSEDSEGGSDDGSGGENGGSGENGGGDNGGGGDDDGGGGEIPDGGDIPLGAVFGDDDDGGSTDYNMDGAFSGSKNSQIASEIQSSSGGNIVSTSVQCLFYKVSRRNIRFSSKFVQDVGNVVDVSSALNVIYKYGSIFYYTLTLGGRLESLSVTQYSAYENYNEQTIENANGNGAGANFAGEEGGQYTTSTDQSVDQATSNDISSQTTTSTVITIGGAPGCYSGDIDAISSFGDWAETVDANPYPIQYEFQSILQVIPPNWYTPSGQPVLQLFVLAYQKYLQNTLYSNQGSFAINTFFPTNSPSFDLSQVEGGSFKIRLLYKNNRVINRYLNFVRVTPFQFKSVIHNVTDKIELSSWKIYQTNSPSTTIKHSLIVISEENTGRSYAHYNTNSSLFVSNFSVNAIDNIGSQLIHLPFYFRESFTTYLGNQSYQYPTARILIKSDSGVYTREIQVLNNSTHYIDVKQSIFLHKIRSVRVSLHFNITAFKSNPTLYQGSLNYIVPPETFHILQSCGSETNPKNHSKKCVPNHKVRLTTNGYINSYTNTKAFDKFPTISNETYSTNIKYFMSPNVRLFKKFKVQGYVVGSDQNTTISGVNLQMNGYTKPYAKISHSNGLFTFNLNRNTKLQNISISVRSNLYMSYQEFIPITQSLKPTIIVVYNKTGCVGSITNSTGGVLNIQYGSYNLSQFNWNYNSSLSYYKNYPSWCIATITNGVVQINYLYKWRLNIFWDINGNSIFDSSTEQVFTNTTQFRITVESTDNSFGVVHKRTIDTKLATVTSPYIDIECPSICKIFLSDTLNVYQPYYNQVQSSSPVQSNLYLALKKY